MSIDDEIRKLKIEGYSNFVISNQLNLTTSDVRRVLNGEALNMADRETEALSLKREGYSLLYIANRLNFTMSRVEELLKEPA